MPKYVFDSCFVIRHKQFAITDADWVSDVTLFELVQGANDFPAVKALRLIRQVSETTQSLLTIEPTDWVRGCEAIFHLEEPQRIRKARTKKEKGATQRMALDSLLAASAHRVGAIVVTGNYNDFMALKPFLRDMRVMRDTDYINL